VPFLDCNPDGSWGGATFYSLSIDQPCMRDIDLPSSVGTTNNCCGSTRRL